APLISSTVSPRTRSAIRKPPICDGVASPDIRTPKASSASARLSGAPEAALAIRAFRSGMGRSGDLGDAAMPGVPLGGDVEEVAQNLVAVFRSDAFGVELDAV